MGRRFERYGIRPSLLEADLIRDAQRRTGLTDFGSDWFREPLGVLLESIEREATLTPLGRLIQRARLTDALANRLRARALLRQDPAIAEIATPTTIVIAGLQRTGTTLLHRLLAADPLARAVLSWEALHPLPLPGESPDAPIRRAKARRAQRALAYLAPDFFAIHPVEFDAPEEDVLLLDQSFMSQVPEATMSVPTYSHWLERQDHFPAYEELRAWLRILHWQRRGQHWLLKSPQHLEHIEPLVKIFPHLVVVQTHRDPRRCIPSFCSMTTHGRRLLSDRVDPVQVAAHWVPRIARMIRRASSARDAATGTKFVDIAYRDLVADPLTQVGRVYRAANLHWTPEVETAIRQVLAVNPPHKYGRHTYSLADFGLTDADIERNFADYRTRFSIEPEPFR